VRSRTAGWSFFLAESPPAPPAAHAIFGSSLPLAERYAELLAGPAVQRGLLGPHEVGRLWDRHLLNCGAVAELVPHPCSLVDIGSGAGLPGMVLAILLPDVQVVLLEPMARRASFLEECVTLLGLRNTKVCRSRAQEVAGKLTADVATARAVAPMERLAGFALSLVRPGGLVLAIKGAGAEGELERARTALRRAGAADAGVMQAGSGKVSQPTIVVRVTAGPGRGLMPPGTGTAAASRSRRTAGT
jgi:16S rRNA (guanine527-N7)-methyltransferase